MKVVAINTVAVDYNAPGRIMTDICRAVNNVGGDTLVVYGRGDAPHGVNSYQMGGNFNFYNHTLKSRLTDSEGLHSIAVTRKMLNELEHFSPDIIHLHNLHGHYLNYPLLFDWLKTSGVPVVWTLHDCWAFTGHCAYYSSVKCNGWRTGCKLCKHAREYPSSYIDRARYNFSKKAETFTSIDRLTVVPVSQWLADEVASSFLNKYPVKVIPNGIATNVFRHMNVENSTPKFKILGVASKWENRKNLQFFIELAHASSAFANVYLVGRLSRKQRKILPDNIMLIGEIKSSEDMARVYSSVNLFINASVAETFGMTTIEAMACGLPIIVNDTTALSEVIAGDAAFVVDINDMGKVLQMIEKIKNEVVPFKTGTSVGHIKTKYDISLMTSAYIQLFKSIL